MDVWEVETATPAPVLVSIHGGGFRHGEKKVSNSLLRECLASGISVVTITYRFSATDIAPAQFHDAARAVQFIRLNAEEWNIDPSRMGATGGSAGAGLSLWLGFPSGCINPDWKLGCPVSNSRAIIGRNVFKVADIPASLECTSGEVLTRGFLCRFTWFLVLALHGQELGFVV
jgi:hypothetical protein